MRRPRSRRAAALETGAPAGAAAADGAPAAGLAWLVTPSRLRQVAGAGLLGAACCAWAIVPVTQGAQFALLAVAVVCLLADLVRLAVPVGMFSGVSTFSSPLIRGTRRAWQLTRRMPAAEGVTLAALILEVTRSARPWHTALLGAGLLCYLLATHLAESGTPARSLRPMLPVLVAGLGLLVLATGAAFLPAAAPGLGAGLLRVLAALAAIAAGVLVLPL